MRGVLLVGAAAVGVVLIRRRRRRRPATVETHRLDPLAVVPHDTPDDAFGILHRAHDEVHAMADRLQDDPPHDADEHNALLARWSGLLIRHETAEEEELWPVVRRQLADGDGLADRGEAEELELRRLLQELSHRSPADVGFRDLVARAARHSYDHNVWEQVHVFPALSRQLRPSERSELGRRLEAAAQRASGRPHLTTAGSRRLSGLMRVVDRLRS